MWRFKNALRNCICTYKYVVLPVKYFCYTPLCIFCSTLVLHILSYKHIHLYITSQCYTPLWFVYDATPTDSFGCTRFK